MRSLQTQGAFDNTIASQFFLFGPQSTIESKLVTPSRFQYHAEGYESIDFCSQFAHIPGNVGNIAAYS